MEADVNALAAALAMAPLGQPAAPPVFEVLPQTEIRLGGALGRQFQGVVKNWLIPVADRNPGILQMFRDRDREPLQNLLPWSGEFAGKYLTAGAEALRLTPSPELRSRLARFVRDLAACQASDGYLGPFPHGHRLDGFAPNVWGGGGDTWDAWGHYHAMLGLILWNEATGDGLALRTAERIGDLLSQTFADRSSVTAGSPAMNQAIVHGLARLAHRTGSAKHLAAARKVVTEFGDAGGGDYLASALMGKDFYQLPNLGPRWESLHAIMGLAELHAATGDPGYRQAFEHLWWSIVRTDRHNNGGFSSGEQAQGNPYDQGAIETCCTIAWIATSVEMLRMAGDPRVADELELSTLNQVAGLHAADGAWCTYNTPMDGVRVKSTDDIGFQIRPGTEELNCCSVNAARGFGLIGDWALMRQKDGLVLNWYGPSTIMTRVGEVGVTLRQMTTYPKDGLIDIEVSPAKPATFRLSLRIPGWSVHTRATLNGELLRCEPGTYLAIDREWKRGDRIRLELDMSLRFWTGERECEGKSSVYRGPVLYALRTGRGKEKFSAGWQKGPRLRVSERPDAWAEFGFEGDSVSWFARKFDDAGKVRMSIDGTEVALVDLYSPQRDVPFAFHRAGLGKGRHRIRVEAAGVRNEASKGGWVNSERFEVLPSFDVGAFVDAVVGGDGALTVRTRDGRKVRLIDYGSAGRNQAAYATWLPIEGLRPEPFSRSNPLRTVGLPRADGSG